MPQSCSCFSLFCCRQIHTVVLTDVYVFDLIFSSRSRCSYFIMFVSLWIAVDSVVAYGSWVSVYEQVWKLPYASCAFDSQDEWAIVLVVAVVSFGRSLLGVHSADRLSAEHGG